MPEAVFDSKPDYRERELIADCGALTELRAAADALDYKAPAGGRAEQLLEAKLRSSWDQEDRLVQRMCSRRARTCKGHRARALVLQSWWPARKGLGWVEDVNAVRIVAALVRDLADD